MPGRQKFDVNISAVKRYTFKLKNSQPVSGAPADVYAKTYFPSYFRVAADGRLPDQTKTNSRSEPCGEPTKTITR